MPLLATLIPVAMFISITLGTWVLLGMIADRPQTAEDRLQRLLDPSAGRDVAEAGLAKKQELFQAKVAAAAGKLGQSLRPSDAEALGKIGSADAIDPVQPAPTNMEPANGQTSL